MLGVIFICVCCVIWLSLPRRGKSEPPLLKGWWPIIGHSHIFLGNTTYFWQIIKKVSTACTNAGGVVLMNIGFQPYYFITDPKDALTVANVCTNKHYAYDFPKRWLGKGLITASGPIWKSHRKLLMPAFSTQVSSSYQDIINGQARKLVSKLSEKVGSGQFDITVYLREMAAENICLTAFGFSAGLNKGFLKTYADAISVMLELMTKRFTMAWLHSDLIYNLTSAKRKEDEVLKLINGLSDELIKRKRAELQNISENNNKQEKTKETISKPLLELLIELSGNTLSDQELREEMDTAITASLDTISWMLTYTLIHLGAYPDVQERVYNEIEEVLGETDRDVEKHDLPKLTYMEMVLKETLRLHTTGQITLRTLEHDIPLRNCTLKAGGHCILSLYGVHRDPSWGKDPDRFLPERWLEPGVRDNVFAGFSLGRRTCIGKPYAMMSLKSALCYFLRRYRVAANSDDLEFKLDFVLKPVSGYLVSIEKR